MCSFEFIICIIIINLTNMFKTIKLLIPNKIDNIVNDS